MHKLFYTLILFFCINQIYAQMGEWTWMNGDTIPYSTGHYGTQGIFDSLNSPPSLYEACEWTDNQGNFWLFGGTNYGFALNYCDLWEFKPSINQWAWIKGTGLPDQSGIYGMQGIPSSNNNPGAGGWGALSWVDTSNNLWLFGGLRFDINGTFNLLNDLWKYNILTNEWTWVNGSDTVNNVGNYGNIGIPSINNQPPCRRETNASWTDNNNNLWLFGGQCSFGGDLNDLWRYNISTNEWTWMKGGNTPGQSAIYGIKGVSNINNTPSSRWAYSKWKDNNGNFWLFGGQEFGAMKNDLWKYNISTNEWAWMSGDSVSNGNNILDTSKCISSENNIPAARNESRACWLLPFDNLAVFGGYRTGPFYSSDLWNYNITCNEWTLISGDTSHNPTPVFGIKTISNSNNIPPGICGGAIGWKDNNGNLWMFGGFSNVAIGAFNVMWRFMPDTSCPSLCSQTGIIESPLYNNNLIIYPNPFSDKINITLNNNKLSEIILYDIASRKLLQQKFTNSISLNTSQLAKGIYLYEVRNNHDKSRGVIKKGKVIKQ